MEAIVLAGISTEVASDVAALAIASTGLIGGTAYYGADVGGSRTEPGVELATAVGFFVGLGFGRLPFSWRRWRDLALKTCSESRCLQRHLSRSPG